MRDPSFDKDAPDSSVLSMQETSVDKATGGETAAPLPGLDYEIEILQVPEVEESPFGQYVKECPVCKNAVRCYFINFNEKVVLCENTTCSWPFGYEEPQCLKHDEALSADEEVESLKVMTYGPIPPSGSIISTMAWSEMDRSNKGLDTDDPGSTPSHLSDAERDAKLQEVLKQKEADLQTKKNLQDIKKLNVQLQKTYEDEDEVSCIRNEQWIKHLKNLQNMSGMQLLRKEELAILKEKELQGLTMDIDAVNTAIVINIAPSTSTEPATIDCTIDSTLSKEEFTLKESTTVKDTADKMKSITIKEPIIIINSTILEPTPQVSDVSESNTKELSKSKDTIDTMECDKIEDKVTDP
ncbi:uncharacterized protein LOC125229398 isoform X2 [Leguminivora glycinivorella]|uniref:uncharacterized protein LOC125229398 isoform X2 n=1 Tax=Leguminivora glycinivorella TaxID=1035111 RepID=UPI00200F786F|nr:uncharacterized protein LOC125229398 isoform X2 [Leguminivora glycinivorella]